MKMQDLIESSGGTETENTSGKVVSGIPEAFGRAEVARKAEPRAAAPNTPRAIACKPSRAIARRAAVATIPAILSPLIDVTVHIVKSPRVRFLAADRVRISLTPNVCVLTVPSVSTSFAGRITPRPSGGSASARGVKELSATRN